jgi:hypothetical protein
VSQLMVEMGETDDAQLPFGLKVAQDMRQGDGIGAPRKRYDEVGIATGQPVAVDELSDAIEQLHLFWAGRAGMAGKPGKRPSRAAQPSSLSRPSSPSRPTGLNLVPEGGFEPPTPRL